MFCLKVFDATTCDYLKILTRNWCTNIYKACPFLTKMILVQQHVKENNFFAIRVCELFFFFLLCQKFKQLISIVNTYELIRVGKCLEKL